MVTRRELAKALERDVLDIHGVADLLAIKRSSVNTLLVLPESNFPAPIYETSGEGRRPVRLWYRADIEQWKCTRRRPTSF